MEDYQIFVPSDQTALVCYKYKWVANARELNNEALAAIKPMIMDRWRNHWLNVAQIAPQKLLSCSPREIMSTSGTMSPSMYYPCPEELARKAIVAQKVV